MPPRDERRERQPAAHWRTAVREFVEDHARQIVLLLSELVKIPSISGSDEENTIQARMAQELVQLDLDVDSWEIPLLTTLASEGFPGVEVDRREAWGLVGCARGAGGGRSLMLNGHVDVVPPGTIGAWGREEPFGGAIGDGFVWGRGSCDMKGGLVAALWALRTLIELKVPLDGDLVVACVQGEEDGGLGTFATLARGWRADACVIPEPTSLDLVPAAAGSLTFRLRITGRACHASRRTAGVSAIEKFWPVFDALRQLEAHRNVSVHPLMARWDIAYPIEIGVVRAGDWSSSVPDSLVAEGRYGLALEEEIESAKLHFEQTIRTACESDTWLDSHPVEVEWWGVSSPPA